MNSFQLIEKINILISLNKNLGNNKAIFTLQRLIIAYFALKRIASLFYFYNFSIFYYFFNKNRCTIPVDSETLEPIFKDLQEIYLEACF